MAPDQLQIQNPLPVTAAASSSAAAVAVATATATRAKMLKIAFYKETESSSYASAAAKEFANKKSTTENKSSMDISKKPCLCAPTTHAGSFKCRLHRAIPTQKSSSASSQSIGVDDKQKLSCRKITQCGGVNGRLQLSRFGRVAAAAIGLGS